MVRVSERAGERVAEVVRAAQQAGIPVRRVARNELDRATGGGVHQGLIAEVAEPDRVDLLDLRGDAESPALVVVLDGIEDPHNVGAIIRSVDAAGGTGVVRQSRHAASLDGAAAKAS